MDGGGHITWLVTVKRCPSVSYGPEPVHGVETLHVVIDAHGGRSLTVFQ